MKRKGVFSNLVLGGLCVMLLAIARTNSTTTEAPPTSPLVVTVDATDMPTETTVIAVTTAPDPAAPLVPDNTVVVLETALDNSNCASQRICAAEPSECNPSNTDGCFFVGAAQSSGQNFDFGLSGESDGYLACTLSTDSTLGGNDITYVCANNNSVVQFFGALLDDNGVLTVTEVKANNVKGRIDGRKIQCTFSATVPDSSARASQFALAVSTGDYDSTTGRLGAINAQLQTAPVDISNPNGTTTNTLNTTTTNTTTASPTSTTNSQPNLQQSLATALLLTVGVMSLLML